MTTTRRKKESITLLTNGLMPLVRDDIKKAYGYARRGNENAWLRRMELIAEKVATYTLENEIKVKKTLRL